MSVETIQNLTNNKGGERMVTIIEHVAIIESGEILYSCSVCGFVDNEPFPEIVPYRHEIRKCPRCGSIVKTGDKILV